MVPTIATVAMETAINTDFFAISRHFSINRIQGCNTSFTVKAKKEPKCNFLFWDRKYGGFYLQPRGYNGALATVLLNSCMALPNLDDKCVVTLDGLQSM